MTEAKFSVGQIVIYKGKKEIPVKILEVTTDDGEYFYRIDRKNCLHGSMLRAQHETEKGA